MREFLIKVASALGASESKMRWRFHRLAAWRRRASRKAEVKSEHIAYAHKKCGACRSLNDKDDKLCASCGEPLRWRITQMVERAGAGGLATASALLVGLITIVYIAAFAGESGPLELRQLILEARADIFAADGPSWQLLARPFLHASLLGVLAVAFAIFLLGQEIEAIYGRAVMLAWFASTSLVGAAGHDLLIDSAALGAQIGLCGLIGVGALSGHRVGGHRGRELRNLMIKWAICVFAVLLLVRGNIVAELIAAAAGALIGRFVPAEKIRQSDAAQLVLGALGAAMILAGAAVAALAVTRTSLWGF